MKPEFAGWNVKRQTSNVKTRFQLVNSGRMQTVLY